MTLRVSDLQSDSDLDSIRNSCDVSSHKFAVAGEKELVVYDEKSNPEPISSMLSVIFSIYNVEDLRSRVSPLSM